MKAFWSISVARRAAWAVLRQHRVRSLLTLIVCGLGTGGVIVAGVLGQANVAEMQQRLRSLGGSLIVVSPNKLPPFPGRPRQLEHFISLVPEDARALSEQVPHLSTVVPIVARNTTVRWGSHAARVRLIGTDPDYLRIRSFTLAHGRFLHQADNGERVIVLGHAVGQELAADGLRLGEIVYLGGSPYLIVGVLQPQGVNFAGEDEDHQVFIPISTYLRRVSNRPWLSHLYVQLDPEAAGPPMVQKIQAVLRARHGRWRDEVEDTLARDFAELSAQQSGLLATVVWAVSVTSGLIMLMGVVGIATLLLLVVRRRRAEIGLRRALGATPYSVAIQFFVEGIALAAVGVVAGLGTGVAASMAITDMMGVPFTLDARMVTAAAVFSLTTSAAACLFPAISAARLEPAAALR